MTTSPGRIVCPYCGTNNFDTVSVCWRCQKPLTSGAAAPYVSASSSPEIRPAPGMQNQAWNMAASLGDEGAAKRSALWMAITMPYVGLPVGWAFIMTADRKKQEIGRFCILWSSVAMVFHVLLLFVAMQSLTPMLASLPGIIKSVQQGQSGGGGGGGLGLP